jgi:hypothetical protein
MSDDLRLRVHQLSKRVLLLEQAELHLKNACLALDQQQRKTADDLYSKLEETVKLMRELNQRVPNEGNNV